MGLLEIVKEQVDFGFTGKINILSNRSQHVGVIYLIEGFIVGSQYNAYNGLRALKRAIFDDLESQEPLKFIVEPEIIDERHCQYKVEYAKLLMDIQGDYEAYRMSSKLKPPGHIQLIVNPEIILNDEVINHNEFFVLKTISDFSLVKDIYEQCPLEEYEITRALVDLRRKKAIKVYQKPTVSPS